MRIHEAAKELGIDSKEIIELLKSRDIAVKSHMSKIPDEIFEEYNKTVPDDIGELRVIVP